MSPQLGCLKNTSWSTAYGGRAGLEESARAGQPQGLATVEHHHYPGPEGVWQGMDTSKGLEP